MTDLALSDQKPLPPRQEAFCHFYILEGNGKAAAVEAGYAGTYARQQAYKLLQNGRVASRIEELRAELRDRHSATADNIIERYRKMAMGNPLSLVVADGDTGLSRFKTPDELTDDERGMIADVSIRTTTHTLPDGTEVQRQQYAYKLVNVKDSLDSLSRTFGLFRDRVEHEHHHKITQLFEYVAANPANSETVAMLDAKYKGRALIEGELADG